MIDYCGWRVYKVINKSTKLMSDPYKFEPHKIFLCDIMNIFEWLYGHLEYFIWMVLAWEICNKGGCAKKVIIKSQRQFMYGSIFYGSDVIIQLLYQYCFTFHILYSQILWYHNSIVHCKDIQMSLVIKKKTDFLDDPLIVLKPNIHS